MYPMNIDTFGGKIVNCILLPPKEGYSIYFDENLLKWKYAATITSFYSLRSYSKTI
jgi:hypothetical protein